MTKHMYSRENQTHTACGRIDVGDGVADADHITCDACRRVVGLPAVPGRAPVAHIYSPGNESRTACGKVDTFDSVWSLAWTNSGRITCDACRRLASIDARLERERKTPRPTHLHALGAMCSHHCPDDHVTADVDKATCWHCLRQHEMREAEQGRGIVDVPGVPQEAAVAVGYDDPTGDDVAADVGPRWGR